MSGSNVTATQTLLCTRLDSLNMELRLSDPLYRKHQKKIKISVDDKVKWSYKWTDTFAPTLGQDLFIPVSSTVKVSFIGKHRLFRHLLGSYSGRISDFLFDKETSLILHGEGHGACATLIIRLTPVIDYQKALNDWVDASLTRLDNNQVLTEGLDNIDQAISSLQATNSALQTSGQYIVPLGQALQLMIKLIDNVAEAHPFLKVGWTLLSSVYTAIQQQRLIDRDVQGLAENLRELVGVACHCPVAEIKGTPAVIESIVRLSLDVGSLIDEYAKSSFRKRVVKTQIDGVKERITKCQAELRDLYEKLKTRIIAYTAKRVKEMHEEMQEASMRRDAQKLSKEIRDWLKVTNPSINHKSARDTHVKGTGSWLPKDERFRQWLHERGKAMWLSAGPGFGKTVLFSTSVEDVRRHISEQGSTCGFAYYYIDARSGAASRTFDNLLRSLLDQLCFNQANIPDAMKRLYGDDRGGHPQPTLEQLGTALGEVVKGFDEVYILIDALDECDSQAELLDWMRSLQSSTQALHLFVTSRPERIIEGRMTNFSHVRIPLTSDLLDDDIKTYVDAHVEASEDLRILMTEEMKKKLRVRGDGM
ncbi:hypothetical protein BDN67DRAFT_1016472 [Paxillus ammoniavirescens]|nr:hypothetical protein BDN67DRAFT_1016472 [Paxillus ammoniavirescens]